MCAESFIEVMAELWHLELMQGLCWQQIAAEFHGTLLQNAVQSCCTEASFQHKGSEAICHAAARLQVERILRVCWPV